MIPRIPPPFGGIRKSNHHIGLILRFGLKMERVLPPKNSHSRLPSSNRLSILSKMAKHWYVSCKKCGEKIRLEVATGPGVVRFRRDEEIPCQSCSKKQKYTGEDFKIED